MTMNGFQSHVLTRLRWMSWSAKIAADADADVDARPVLELHASTAPTAPTASTASTASPASPKVHDPQRQCARYHHIYSPTPTPTATASANPRTTETQKKRPLLYIYDSYEPDMVAMRLEIARRCCAPPQTRRLVVVGTVASRR
jgi:hypothetical protein